MGQDLALHDLMRSKCHKVTCSCVFIIVHLFYLGLNTCTYNTILTKEPKQNAHARTCPKLFRAESLYGIIKVITVGHLRKGEAGLTNSLFSCSRYPLLCASVSGLDSHQVHSDNWFIQRNLYLLRKQALNSVESLMVAYFSVKRAQFITPVQK